MGDIFEIAGDYTNYLIDALFFYLMVPQAPQDIDGTLVTYFLISLAASYYLTLRIEGSSGRESEKEYRLASIAVVHAIDIPFLLTLTYLLGMMWQESNFADVPIKSVINAFLAISIIHLIMLPLYNWFAASFAELFPFSAVDPFKVIMAVVLAAVTLSISFLMIAYSVNMIRLYTVLSVDQSIALVVMSSLLRYAIEWWFSLFKAHLGSPADDGLGPTPDVVSEPSERQD